MKPRMRIPTFLSIKNLGSKLILLIKLIKIDLYKKHFSKSNTFTLQLTFEYIKGDR